MKLEKLLPWVVVAGVFYTLYKVKDVVGGTAGDAAAKVYEWLHANVNVIGKVVMPDMSLVSFSGLRTYWVGDQLRVKINNVEYQLHTHDDRGNFPATKV